jgi:hypothetical protein
MLKYGHTSHIWLLFSSTDEQNAAIFKYASTIMHLLPLYVNKTTTNFNSRVISKYIILWSQASSAWEINRHCNIIQKRSTTNSKNEQNGEN